MHYKQAVPTPPCHGRPNYPIYRLSPGCATGVTCLILALVRRNRGDKIIIDDRNTCGGGRISQRVGFGVWAKLWSCNGRNDSCCSVLCGVSDCIWIDRDDRHEKNDKRGCRLHAVTARRCMVLDFGRRRLLQCGRTTEIKYLTTLRCVLTA